MKVNFDRTKCITAVVLLLAAINGHWKIRLRTGESSEDHRLSG